MAILLEKTLMANYNTPTEGKVDVSFFIRDTSTGNVKIDTRSLLIDDLEQEFKDTLVDLVDENPGLDVTDPEDTP